VRIVDYEKIPNWKLPAIFGVTVIVLTFLILGGWSAIAEIDSAVVAEGVIVNESNKSTVSHLEQGIISQIKVREGQHIEKGQVLFRLDMTQAQSIYDGLSHELDSNKSQLNFIIEELKGVNKLWDERLVPKSKVMALDREKARLEGLIGETEEKMKAAKEVLSRTDIVAPISGTLQGLKVWTVGGVIKAGEPLVEIAPDHDDLIIQAHVLPVDVEHITPGMRAEVRFISLYHSNLLPLINGRVDTISRDRLVDDVNHQPYFLTQVVASDIPENVRARLRAGMSAEILVPTGERTVLDYLVKPLKDRLQSALREK
jgi:multidrug efflux pump subunit AcrA (membrane-fusion protein)